jgi:hypothetical protein
MIYQPADFQTEADRVELDHLVIFDVQACAGIQQIRPDRLVWRSGRHLGEWVANIGRIQHLGGARLVLYRIRGRRLIASSLEHQARRDIAPGQGKQRQSQKRTSFHVNMIILIRLTCKQEFN